MGLLAELDAFFTDHHDCGDLDAGVGGPRYRPAVAHPPAGALIDARSPRYFRTHLFVAISHTPLAFSQSAGVVYFAKSSEVCDGLAEGELDGSPDTPGAVVAPLGPPDVPGALISLPVAGLVPGPPEPCRGLFGLVLPGAPLLSCAAAMAGARAMIPTKSISISFCM